VSQSELDPMTTPMRVLALDAGLVMFGFAEASRRSR
jgi:hypothetical protein